MIDLDSDSSIFSQKDELNQAQNVEQDIENYEEKTREIEKIMQESEKAQLENVLIS